METCPRGCGRVLPKKGWYPHYRNCFFPFTLERLRELGSVTADDSECWLWPKTRETGQYGRITDPRTGVIARVHRIAYELANGPTDLHVCHACDNPPCFNPAHLFAGTTRDNVRDMWSKGRAGQQTSPTYKERQAAATRAKWANPEVRARMVEGMKAAWTPERREQHAAEQTRRAARRRPGGL